MIIILSCSKRQISVNAASNIKPYFDDRACLWMQKLAEYSIADLSQILKVSYNLAELNLNRYKNAMTAIRHEALRVFDGDVYRAMSREQWDSGCFNHAQQYVRIISGLYGLLRPQDGIVPYRLEMSTSLPWLDVSLSSYWRRDLTDLLLEESDCIINLASNEYASALEHNMWKKWINIHFWNINKKGKYAVVGVLAKRARGKMLSAICRNLWASPYDLLNFTDGYRYDGSFSDSSNWVFVESN